MEKIRTIRELCCASDEPARTARGRAASFRSDLVLLDYFFSPRRAA